MRHIIITALAVLGFSSTAIAQTPQPPQKTPDEWRAAAVLDLKAAHDTLRDNSPATVVDRDSAHFREWLEAGYTSSAAMTSRIQDGYGYVFLMRRYLRGFHDGHISFNEAFPLVLNPPKAWTGYGLGLRDSDFKVVYRNADAADAPPLGAVLKDCNGLDAESFARSRDPYDADRALYSGRLWAAYFMTFDRGNPFVALPTVCTFRTDHADKAYPVHWRPMTPADVEAASSRALGGVSHKLSLEPWTPGRWWVNIPSMGDGQDWKGFFAAITAHQADLRNADRIVIDLRGNGGGSSGYAYTLAGLLWGQAMTDARQPVWGPEVWRASPLNLEAARVARARIPTDDKDGLTHYNDLIARLEAAIKAGQPTVTLSEPSGTPPPMPADNPMHAKVILLTDGNCFSACLDLMDLFTRMPNTVQAGMPTGADTIFMELTQDVHLPSGLGVIAFGHKAWTQRIRGSNVAYTPSPANSWSGEPDDETGLRDWLAKLPM